MTQKLITLENYRKNILKNKTKDDRMGTGMMEGLMDVFLFNFKFIVLLVVKLKSLNFQTLRRKLSSL